jgi:hypothetical protein
MRIHANLWVTNTVAAGFEIAVGFIVDNVDEATTTSQALGTPFSLNPLDEPYVPWMLYQRHVGAPTLNPMAANNVLTYDIRSKRKIPNMGDTLLMSAVTVSGATALTARLHARVLLAMP